MTETKGDQAGWVRPVCDMLAAARWRGTFFVAIHEYRPAMVHALAEALGLQFRDFRAERLRPLGWEAGRMPLAALTQAIETWSQQGGLVLHNAEALLAAKTSAERRQWFAEMAARDWPVPVVIPIAIFQVDLPQVADRFHRVDPDELPEETLLTRLATQ